MILHTISYGVIPMKNLSYQQVIDLLGNHHIILVDVQTKQDYQIAHISRSINIPLEEIAHKINEIIIDKNTPIIVCCQKGIRSLVAADILTQKGYQNVYNLKDGFE